MSRFNKDQKKQRVLHTRVSEHLDSELREKAAALGVSVSNLVRNILLNTVEIVEEIVIDGTSIAKAAVMPDAPEAPVSEPQILGWQELTLNLNALCASCNGILAKGCVAAIAVCDTKTTPIFHCLSCVSALSQDGSDQGES
ncbi:MAG: hypothetical protein JKY56_21450 [Kofleriaceae bacterium]|nr:hypothetical protein [Kofleriaceae bacterium]